MDFLLQINAHGPVRANDLVGANAGIRRNVAVAGRDRDIRAVIADSMMRPLDRRSNEPAEKDLMSLTP